MIRFLKVYIFCLFSLGLVNAADTPTDSSEELSDVVVDFEDSSTNSEAAEISKGEDKFNHLPEDILSKNILSKLDLTSLLSAFLVNKTLFSYTQKKPFDEFLLLMGQMAKIDTSWKISLLPSTNVETIYSVNTPIIKTLKISLDSTYLSGHELARIKRKFIKKNASQFEGLANSVVIAPAITDYSKLNEARQHLGDFFGFELEKPSWTCGKILKMLGRNPYVVSIGSAVLMTTFGVGMYYLFYNGIPKEELLSYVKSKFFYQISEACGGSQIYIWNWKNTKFCQESSENCSAPCTPGSFPGSVMSNLGIPGNISEIMEYTGRICDFNLTHLIPEYENYVNTTDAWRKRIPITDIRDVKMYDNDRTICTLESLNFPSGINFQLYKIPTNTVYTKYKQDGEGQGRFVFLYSIFLGPLSFLCICLSICSFCCR